MAGNSPEVQTMKEGKETLSIFIPKIWRKEKSIVWNMKVMFTALRDKMMAKWLLLGGGVMMTNDS